MSPRRVTALLAALALAALGVSRCNAGTATPPALTQVKVDLPGYVEPHTPGSGAPEEMAPTSAVSDLLGPDPDLNTVTYFRTSLPKPDGAPPRAILILIPGFLGGGTTFDPLARQLVKAFNGNLEVWAVDRRPNQLEDRLGAMHAEAGAGDPACTTSPPASSCSIFEGAQFYFPDTDNDPVVGVGGAAGPEDLDVNLNGIIDDRLPLVDSFGVTRGPRVLSQDDARFLAYWGIDTYMRDWKMLVDAARAIVGDGGLVLIGGHSQGTSWASVYLAYDFDPDPAVVDAGHDSVDGLLFLEGGGIGPGVSPKPNLAEYQATVASLASNGGPDVFLTDFSGIVLQDLGQAGEVSSLAAYYQPDEISLVQRTPTFGSGLVGQLINLPATNETVLGLFLDDDFSPIGAFRASIGFSNGFNLLNDLDGAGGFLLPAYLAIQYPANAPPRTWQNSDEAMPSCPPNAVAGPPGCAILDNGPPSDPLDPLDPPRNWGVEAEVSDLFDFAATQFGKANGFEWYFVDGRVSLDFSYGNDSSALVAESLLADPGDEGPLRITQQAGVDVPVLAIGGSNGLAPEPKSFDRYLDSIATPEADQEVVILEGYAHLDVTIARDNAGVPYVTDWINRLLQRKLLASF
jgi:pimeloyl-ACP methyl ester carboxylesterase